MTTIWMTNARQCAPSEIAVEYSVSACYSSRVTYQYILFLVECSLHDIAHVCCYHILGPVECCLQHLSHVCHHHILVLLEC